MAKNSIYEIGIFQNKKHLNAIIEGIICRLIISGNDYVQQERLFKAINQYFIDRNIKIDKNDLEETIDNAFISLYKSHKIIPDVLHNKGFIINTTCTQAVDSVNEFLYRSNSVIRPTPYPVGIYGFPMLYSREEACWVLNEFDYRSQMLINSLANNYFYNYMDICEIFEL